jgi:Uma2 family endonuclease
MSAQPASLLQRHQLDIIDYYRMAEAGILGEDDRYELIEGEIIDRAPIGSEHASTVVRLSRLLTRCVADQAVVTVQNPVRLDLRNEPQPDIALLRYRDDFYRDAHPGPQDVLLIIEVADSSARYDREIKLPLYARHGIPEVWIVDLRQQRVDIHRQPEEAAYRETRTATGPDSVSPLALPECRMTVSTLF